MVWDHIIVRTQGHELIIRIDDSNLTVARGVAVVALPLTNRKGVAIREDVLGKPPLFGCLHPVGGWLVLSVGLHAFIIPTSQH